MKEKNFELKSNDFLKEAIIYILFRYDGLTAKEIQEKLGLKRQTTYNYLSELVEKNEIGMEESFLESNPNVKTIIYKYKRRTPLPVNYKARLRDVIKDKSPDAIRNELNHQIKMTIASLIETMSSINNIEDEQLLNYISKTNFGPGLDILLLSDQEYDELGTQFQNVLIELWKKWKSNMNKENKNIVHIGGLKSFEM